MRNRKFARKLAPLIPGSEEFWCQHTVMGLTKTESIQRCIDGTDDISDFKYLPIALDVIYDGLVRKSAPVGVKEVGDEK